MNYQQLAKDIIERIGGLNNIKDVTIVQRVCVLR